MNDSRKDSVIAQSDQGAAGYSRRYADPDAIAKRQVELVRGWGTPLPPGSSVLEIGCADGVITEHLAAAGYLVRAVDISPRMCEVTAARLESKGLEGDVEVADMEVLEPDQKYDAVIAVMYTFFRYATDPRAALGSLAGATGTKLIVDLNPRVTEREEATEMVRAAGFDLVEWRASFVPQRFALGKGSRLALHAAERLPGVRELVLRRKFTVMLKGERVDRDLMRRPHR